MKKSVISLLLTLLLALLFVFSALPVAAVESGGYTFSDSIDWDRYADSGITLNVYNWGEYISVDSGEGEFDVNREFERLTGIKVNYTTYATNEELYAKMKSGGASYDVIIPSDYMIARMIQEDMLLPLNFDNIPNFSYIMEDYRNPVYDPENAYSVPYTWGTVGIIYNKDMVDTEDLKEGWGILWNEKYANNILMFSNSRDAFAIALSKLGYSFNTTDKEELSAAAEELKKQKLLVQAYVMDEIFDKMGGGEAALAPYYAGDATTMLEENESLGYYMPEHTNRFVDAMCIPATAKNKEAAELYINFMCETQTALANCEYIGYSTPHAGAFEQLDAEITENEIAYPSQEKLETTEVFTYLPDATTKYIDSLWSDVLGTTNDNPWLMPILMLAALALSLTINIVRAKRGGKDEY